LNRIFGVGADAAPLSGNFMRTILISLAVLYAALCPSARAEQQLFLVANDADGYGIDRCLASGEKCGSAAANAYCRTQAFTVAASYHKAGHGDLTEATVKDASSNCETDRCDVVAIVCLR
jgi:hypothetical protein